MASQSRPCGYYGRPIQKHAARGRMRVEDGDQRAVAAADVGDGGKTPHERPSPFTSHEMLEATMCVVGSGDQVRDELGRIVSSAAFARADRLRRLLRFLVEQTLAGNCQVLKEWTIAVEVCERRPCFDPKTDPIVRVDAARLRARLQDYYSWIGGLQGSRRDGVPAAHGVREPCALRDRPAAFRRNERPLSRLAEHGLLATVRDQVLASPAVRDDGAATRGGDGIVVSMMLRNINCVREDVEGDGIVATDGTR